MKVYIIKDNGGYDRKPLPLDKARYEARKHLIEKNGYRLATEEELISFGIKKAKKETKIENTEKQIENE